MTSDRRAFLASLASSAALAGCSGAHVLPSSSNEASGPAAAIGRHGNAVETIPMTIVNSTGTVATKNVWFMLYGQGVEPDEKWYHVVDASGKLARCTTTNGEYSADYNFNLGATSTMNIPTLRAARLYISFNKKLLLQVNNKGIPTPPSGYDSSPSNVNYGTVWDFVEWTYNPAAPKGSGWNGNLTLVDSVNIPIDFRIIGTDEVGNKIDATRGFLPGGYSKFIQSLKSQPPFAKLVLPGTGRVLAPNIGTLSTASPGGPVFDKNYYNSYIDAVWNKYKNQVLTANTNLQGRWTGKVANGKMTFTQQDGTPKLAPIVFKKPTTVEVFACANICTSGCGGKATPQEDVNNQIRAALLAAFNRSTLLTTPVIGIKGTSTYCKAPGTFYQNAKTNYYAKFIHANARKGLAYTFGIDDVCDQSSFVAVRIPKSLVITLIPQ